MIKRFLIILVVGQLCSCNSHTKTAPDNSSPDLSASGSVTESKAPISRNGNWNSHSWQVSKVVGDTLIFMDGSFYKTNLYNPGYIGYLPAENKPPYFILSGTDCDQCDENISIYIHSPGDGDITNDGMAARYNYPGKEYDWEKHKLVADYRMFYGNCFSDNAPCVVWVQKELTDKGKFIKSIFVVEIEADSLKESKIDYTDSLVSSIVHRSTELKGKEMTTEP